ncbi:MarR family transcriptional regulator [Streptomyces zhihengii]|uniref:MarR family transcriptional regulator n=1 Tax=Streptomyces zhihengii TaxID=1818004 RepID=UPI0033A5C670
MTTLIPAVLAPVAVVASVGVLHCVRAGRRREAGKNRILDHLALHDGSTQEEIARGTGLSNEQVAALVEQLRALGKVNRRASYDDPGSLRHRLVEEWVAAPVAEEDADADEVPAPVHGPY